ncbi:MAG: glycoside hydrolase family 3 C-terminal domain-containing protein [Prevotella sp.]|nr:glycoside hydrolase family 3 C-terminal domain-containing protein [Prevotella sp.]
MIKTKFYTFLAITLLCVQTVKAQSQPVYLDETKDIEVRVEDALRRMTLDEKIRVIHAQSKFSSAGVPRLGFPDFWTDDGPHGVRPDVLWDEWEQAGQTNDSCVAFPALTCLAATWNPQLSLIYGESLGEEALYRGKNMILGPGVNIYRTPLNGRNFEYMGEDPYLASRMVVPYIQGLQSKGVAACVKHYALNNDEEYRHQVNVIVSDRALHEIYLPAFKAAITEGKAWGIMGAYNLYKNQHNCHNAILINKILKQDWQFDGVVVSDWGGTHDTDEAVKNGLDLEFGTWTDGLTMGATNAYDNYYLANAYKRLIKEGKYTTKELDDKVRRVLRLFYRTTMNRQRPHGFLCSESHYEAARKIAEEGIVLLKNEGGSVLPININKVKNILVVGENAVKMMTVGGGSSSLKVQREVSPLDGLRARLKGIAEVDYARGYVGDVTGAYNGVTTGQDLSESRSEDELIAEAVEKAKKADYVIVFGGLNKSDYQDCEGHDRKDYALPYAQNKLVEALAQVNSRLVFVNISGNAVAMPWIKKVPAVIQGWFIGSEAGNALASVLVGDANPSGKLPFSWMQSLDHYGAHALGAYPGTWRSNEKIIDEEYKEDIFVGYRWADRHKLTPLFPFGHGLSYTTFEYARKSRIEKSADDTSLFTLHTSIKNTGSRSGAETVQLYIRDVKSSLPRPVKELKGFQKVTLAPGEQRDITFTIDKSMLSYYDDSKGEWVMEPGRFEALIGASAGDIKSKVAFEVK